MGRETQQNDDVEMKEVTTPVGADNVVQPEADAPPDTSALTSLPTSTAATRRASASSASTSSPSSQQQNQQTPARRHAEVLNDVRPFKRYKPWLVPGFVVANVVLFVITMYVNDCPKNSATSCLGKSLGRFSFQPMKENRLLGPSAATLEKMGALIVNRVVNEHQVWRLLSCIWLHAGVFHLLANMLSLVVIGIGLEQEFGFVRVWLLYVISGFGGSLLSALFIQQRISVGASGALFGLLGAILSELIANWTIYANKLAALLTLTFIIITNLAVGILPHVDNFAHIGGFLTGFFLGFVFLTRPQFGWVSQKNAPQGYIITSRVKSKHKKYQYVLWFVSVILLIAGLTLGLIMLLRGTNLNDQCSWCHYLSCVPTSLWNCKNQLESCGWIQIGDQLNMTCTDNGKSNLYSVSPTDSSMLQQLCSELCS